MTPKAKKPKKFTVEMMTASGWTGADWCDTNENGDRTPWLFDSRAEARREIQDFVRECREEGMEGYRCADYRVVEALEEKADA